MTKVSFYKEKGFYTGFTFDGHAMFNPAGPDIVCSAVSMAGQMTLNGLQEVAKVRPTYNVDDGHLGVSFNSESPIAQALVETLKLAIDDLCNQYSGFISLSVIERGE